ncbi:MAG: class I SAM-dependent methyltransferase [Polyangiaceae bacterium]|nr:class I SAM-dependent methyltransferase [Polyangiaceae bacterium]
MLATASIEEPDCPLCGARSSRRLRRFPAGTPWGLVACDECGLAYLSPRPSPAALAELYRAADYFASESEQGYGSYEAQEEPLRRTFRRLLVQLAAGGHTGGSLLEVGCGYGYLLDEARPHFRRRVGTDLSEGAIAVARGRADAAHVGGVEAAAGELFDVVIANHVVEHVVDPVGFLRGLTARCRPGGRVVVSTPDFGSPWRRALGGRWPSFKLPEHVLYFDRDTLRRAMDRAGLECLEDVPYPHAFPLPLVAAKVGVSLPPRLGRYSLWLPRTTVAALGRAPGGAGAGAAQASG